MFETALRESVMSARRQLERAHLDRQPAQVHRHAARLLDLLDRARANDIDGHEVARRIRLGRNRHATLIALTGYGQPEDRQRALAAGFDVHLVKPVTLERLDEAIATASRHARQPVARTGD